MSAGFSSRRGPRKTRAEAAVRLTAAVSFGLLLAATAAAAQRPDSAAAPQAADTPVATLSELRVEVSRLSVGGVEAGRVPFFVSTRSQAEIRASGARVLSDALSTLPGVHANDELGADFQPDITVRGFTVSPVVGLPQSLSVFVDGVRVNEPDAAQVHFDLIPLQDVEQVQLIRGPMGPFGRNTLAGALNIVTRRGGPTREAELELTGGSFGQFEGRAQASGMLGPIDYYASGRYLRSDGWRQVTAARLAQAYGKLGWRGRTSDAWISYFFARDSIEQAGSLPASWLAGDLPPTLAGVTDPRKINFTGGDFFVPLLHFAIGNYLYRPSGTLALRATASFRRNEIEQFNANITEANTRGLSKLWSADVTAQVSYQPHPELVLTGGFEYARDDVDARIFAEPNSAAPDSGLTTHVTTQQDTYGAFTQAWWSPRPEIALLASVRYDLARVPFRDLLDPANNGTNTFRQLTASLGVDYAMSERTSGFASYGHGFRAPVILELACADPDDPCPLPFELGADPPLDPVTTDTWQVGFRLLDAARGTELELSAYWSEVHDEIFNVVAPPTTRGFFQNIARTRRQGVELRAAVRPHPRLALKGDLTYTLATFRSAATLAAAFLEEGDTAGAGAAPSVEPGDRFPLIPELQGSLGLGYRHAGWRVDLTGSYTGGQWLRGDEDNSRPDDRLDPYLLIDLQVERAIGRGSLYVAIENLLDTSYETFGVLATNPKAPGGEGVEPFLTPGLPRRLLAGFRWGL